ncbi:MAG: hypothetical protein MJZ61_06525 [Bacteroidales bacterium]|nr:hypothetical protein [Bacteroidales bacterium]
MKKLAIGAGLILALSGCGGTAVDNSVFDRLLTDLSEVQMLDFNGPNPGDAIMIDFAVKRLVLDTPEAFQESGRNLVIDADKVHAKAQEYFDFAIDEDQNTNEVDFTKDGRYQIMKGEDPQYAFSKCKVLKDKNDTIFLDVDIYACNRGWKGTLDTKVEDFETVDPDNIPQRFKTMRSVLVRKDGAYKVISYKVTQK